MLNYSTAWFALERAAVRPRETVFVHGAAGGVCAAALDLLRGLGTRSIAVVSSDAKERAARTAGADEVVRSTGPWLDQVRQLTGGLGVEVVLDPVGGKRFPDSLRALDVAGRLVVIGFADGSIPTVKVNRLLLRNLTLIGQRLRLAVGPESLRILDRREAIGKLVVEVRPDLDDRPGRTVVGGSKQAVASYST